MQVGARLVPPRVGIPSRSVSSRRTSSNDGTVVKRRQLHHLQRLRHATSGATTRHAASSGDLNHRGCQATGKASSPVCRRAQCRRVIEAAARLRTDSFHTAGRHVEAGNRNDAARAASADRRRRAEVVPGDEPGASPTPIPIALAAVIRHPTRARRNVSPRYEGVDDPPTFRGGRRFRRDHRLGVGVHPALRTWRLEAGSAVPSTDARDAVRPADGGVISGGRNADSRDTRLGARDRDRFLPFR